MIARVRCDTCHRTELWSPDGAGWRVEVSLEGGARRTTLPAQRARGETAIRSATGGPRAVGVCEACGQLLTTTDPRPPAIRVQIDTPDGPLVIDGDAIRGPAGLTGADAGRAFLDKHFPVPREPWLPQIGRTVFMLWLVVVVLVWVAALSVVVAMLANLGTGAPKAVSGGEDWRVPHPPSAPAQP